MIDRRLQKWHLVWIVLGCLLVGQLTLAILLPSAEAPQNVPAAPPEFTWTPEWEVSRTRPGYRLLPSVSHFSIQSPSETAGAYHHHPQITRYQNTFFACWSSHRSGEDGPGQRVLFSSSRDGELWTPSKVLFPALDIYKASTETGRALTAQKFVQTNDQLFAMAEVHDNTGFVEPNVSITAQPQSAIRTDRFSKRSRKGIGRLIREVHPNGSLGAIYWLQEIPPQSITGFGNYPVASPMNTPAIMEIRRITEDPLTAPTWDFLDGSTEILASDGTFLVEPTTYRSQPNQFCRLWRAENKSLKMYAQTSVNGIEWTPATATPIPDAPSKTVACQLESLEILLIGNQVFNERGTRRDPLTMAVSSNGFDFDRAFSIRWRSPKFRTPQLQSEPDGRGTGFQYPSVILDGESVWVIYSVNKEAIDVSRIPIQSLFDY